METTQQNEFMTPEELAKHLQVSRSAIYRMVENRSIAVYRICSRLRFKRSDVEKYVEGQCYPAMERKRL